MLQFAHVAWPAVFQQLAFRLTGESFHFLMVFPVVSVQKMFRQRRDAQFDGVDAVEQVLTETSLRHPFVEVGVGGADQPHVNLCRLHRPQPHGLPFLDGGEQLGLHGQGEVSYLVEKERASRSDFHPSRLCLARIGEGPLFVAEQLAFEKLFGDASQVDGHEGRFLPGREMLQHACHEVFPRTVLAENQDVGVRVGELEDGFLHLPHGGRVADEFGQPVVGSEGEHLRLQSPHFLARAAELQGRRESGEQLLLFPRFRHEIGGSLLDGADCLFGVGISGHEHHHGLRVGPQNLVQAVEALLSADGVTPEVHVEQDDIGLEGGHEMSDARGLGGHFHLFHIGLEQQVEGEEHVFVVVDNQYFSFFFHYVLC